MLSLKGSQWLFTVTGGGEKSPAIYFLWRHSSFLNVFHLIPCLSRSLSLPPSLFSPLPSPSLTAPSHHVNLIKSKGFKATSIF